jgi:SPP1 family predicted phage head-tail adaptor
VAKLNKRVTIQNVSRVSDGQGGFTETWTDSATVWAGIEPVKSYERFQAMQQAVPVSHKITMRYNAVVDETSRMRYGNRLFEVKEVINVDEADRFLQIRAIETETVSVDTETLRFLLEDGFALLLEDGSNLLQEAA